MTYLGIGGKLLGPVYQPEVKPILRRTQIAGQFCVVTLGIVDQVSGVYFEKARQQHAGRVSEMSG